MSHGDAGDHDDDHADNGDHDDDHAGISAVGERGVDVNHTLLLIYICICPSKSRQRIPSSHQGLLRSGGLARVRSWTSFCNLSWARAILRICPLRIAIHKSIYI